MNPRCDSSVGLYSLPTLLSAGWARTKQSSPLGLIIGGYLLDHLWWDSIFFINLPVSAFALVLDLILIPETRSATAPRPDYTGLLLSTSGLAALVHGAIQQEEYGWGDVRVWGVLGADALGSGLRLLPLIGGPLVASRLSPRLVARYGAALVIAGSGVIMAAGMGPRRVQRRRHRPWHGRDDLTLAVGAGIMVLAALLAVNLLAPAACDGERCWRTIGT